MSEMPDIARLAPHQDPLQDINPVPEHQLLQEQPS